jgi:phosphatidylglycerophosphatase A
MTMGRCLAKSISSGLGSGFFPKAPGTAGSAAFAVLWWVLHRAFAAGLAFDVVLALAVAAIGTLAVSCALVEEAAADPQWIVVDEWAGMAVALAGAPSGNLFAVCGTLIAFRIFDVWKPGPIGWAERLPRAWGVMADDIIGGFFALAVVQAVLSFV